MPNTRFFRAFFLLVFYQAIFWANMGYSQTVDVALFLKSIENSKADSQKVDALIAYSDSLILVNQYNDALLLAKFGRKLSEEINYKKGICQSHVREGIAYKMLSKTDSAFYHYKIAERIATETADKKNLALIHVKRGWLYAMGNYLAAIEEFGKALKIANEIGDTLLVATAYWGFAENYSVLGNYPEAFSNSFKALRLFEQLNSYMYLARVYTCIGYLYDKQNNFEKAFQAHNLSLNYAKKSGIKFLVATANAEIGDLYFNKQNYAAAKEKFALAFGIFNELGERVYLAESYEKIGQISEREGDIKTAASDFTGAHILYNDALLNYLSALKLNKETAWKNAQAESFTSVAGIYIKLKNFSLAKSYSDQGLELAKEIRGKVEIKNAHYTASLLHQETGDYKKALEHYRLFSAYRDSLLNEANIEKSVQTQMQYEFDKKEAAIKASQDKKDVLQQAQVQKLTVLRNSVIVGAALLLLFLLGLINRYRFKQQANKQLATAYENLKATQDQLVKTEKMAAFGIMASRLGHEIQNPLNFVNNFSEISDDIINDLVEGKTEAERKEAAVALKLYLKKINFHGKRAEAIVKQLQEHSRAGTAQKFFEDYKKGDGELKENEN